MSFNERSLCLNLNWREFSIKGGCLVIAKRMPVRELLISAEHSRLVEVFYVVKVKLRL